MVKEIYIAGEWRLGKGNTIQSLFPADQSVNAEISTASLDDVNEAIEKADLAWRQAGWRNSMPHERARILYKVAEIIEARVDELAKLQTRDNGKPLAETRGLVMSAAATALTGKAVFSSWFPIAVIIVAISSAGIPIFSNNLKAITAPLCAWSARFITFPISCI